jgi:hypothetical protein
MPSRRLLTQTEGTFEGLKESKKELIEGKIPYWIPVFIIIVFCAYHSYHIYADNLEESLE